MDLLVIQGFRWFWGLTCDFWAENALKKQQQGQRQLNQSLRQRLRSCVKPQRAKDARRGPRLRQSGSAFRRGLWKPGRRPALPSSNGKDGGVSGLHPTLRDETAKDGRPAR